MQPNPEHLRDSFVYFTECQLATLEQLESIKKTSKSELRRQRTIAGGMIAVCKRLLMSGNDIQTLGCPRVYRAIYPVDNSKG